MARYLHYEDFDKRKNSFNICFPIKGIKPSEFADAGFYSTGFQDYTRCFFCGVGLRGWDDSYDPWEQHARFSSNCKYLLDKKGKDFVLNQDINRGNIIIEQNRNKCIKHEENLSKKLTNEEIILHINSIMDERKVRMLLEYGHKLDFDEKSLRKALKIQFQNNNTDFKDINELLRNSQIIFKENLNNS